MPISLSLELSLNDVAWISGKSLLHGRLIVSILVLSGFFFFFMLNLWAYNHFGKKKKKNENLSLVLSS